MRDPDGGRFSKPVRDTFRRADRGAVIDVVTEYLEWTPRRSDPALFRPPPASAGCVPSPSGTLALAVERRNTLHFNPAHVPRLDPGETFLAEKNAAPGAGAGRGPGRGGAGGCGVYRRRGLVGIRVRVWVRIRPAVARAPHGRVGRGGGLVSGGARFIHPDEAAARARRLRRGAIATRTRHRVRSRTRTGSTPRFDIPAIEDGFDRAWLPGSSKTKTTARVRRRGRASGAARGVGAGSCERETRATKSNDDAVWSRGCWVDRDDARGGGATRSSRRARAFLGFTVREESTS